MKKTAVKDFGKDHWSLLAYVETRCVDYGGILDIGHLRTKHPMIVTNLHSGTNGWKPEYNTRLRGYWKEDGTVDKKRMLKNHDDHDCLDDLEAAGFIKDVGTLMNPFAQMTDEGMRVAGLLRKHKTEGKHYSSFVLEQ